MYAKGNILLKLFMVFNDKLIVLFKAVMVKMVGLVVMEVKLGMQVREDQHLTLL